MALGAPQLDDRFFPRDMLGMTSRGYAEHCAAHHLRGGQSGAFSRYQRLFRSGDSDESACHRPRPCTAGAGRAFEPATAPTVQSHSRWHVGLLTPIARTLPSDNPEGRVLKFTQLVPGRAPTDPPLETESVLIPMIGKKGRRTYTLCVSSQIGCAMGCTFCQTAQMGLIRSLDPHEIVAQWFAARHALLPDPAHGLDSAAPITNLVFMGMGEPLDNLDNVLTAIEVLTDHNGVALPMSKVTISTVGRIDGIRRLAQHVHKPGWHRMGFAVSLNAPADEIRSSIMPVNRAMPLAALRDALLEWPIYSGFKFLFEYVFIPGVNDSREHARLVADFVLGRGEFAGPRLGVLLNLIPYNPRDDSPWPAPEDADIDLFLLWLSEEGVYAKRRRTKGRETMAACGQLGNPAIRRRPQTRPQPTIPLTLALDRAK